MVERDKREEDSERGVRVVMMERKRVEEEMKMIMVVVMEMASSV